MRLPGFLTRNLRLKATAVALAIVTWTVVVYAANPPDTRTVSVPVPQDPSSLPPGYVLDTRVPDITVRVEGTREHVNAFSANDVRVVVDWTVIRRPGPQKIPITVVNNDRDVDLVDAPTSIDADVDRLDTASVPVRVHIVRTPPAGYTIVSGPTVTPDHVVVSGPQRRLVGLVATVDVDLSNWKGAFSRNLPVTLVDPQGNPVTDVGVVNANTVHVEIGIVSVTASRDVGITLTTVGSPAPGHYLVSVQIDPLLVRITGPQDILNGLDTVPTQAINLNGLSADRVVVVGLQLPAGVSAKPALVTVRLGVGVLPAPSPTAQPSGSPTVSPSPTPSPTPAPSPSGSPGHGPVP